MPLAVQWHRRHASATAAAAALQRRPAEVKHCTAVYSTVPTDDLTDVLSAAATEVHTAVRPSAVRLWGTVNAQRTSFI